ncbi:MAG: SDR family NAD(P)-dependent oxidoreductase [Acidimicrobiales bacterium]|nr:SDR family NAD(P)-dependent oxidoreductase [Acidimicrobiales bacterium]
MVHDQIAGEAPRPIVVPRVLPLPGAVAGKRVVVTGASRGLGVVISTAFARAGARVALAARNGAALELLAAELGSETLVVPTDCSLPEDNERLAQTVIAEWGGLDVWISNAGISPVLGGPARTTPDLWRQVIDVNLSGAYYGARAAAAVMTDGGRIMVTASVLADRPRKGLVAYSASKAGIVAMVKALALDLADDGILVNAVAPGWFDSPLTEAWQANERLGESILGHTALHRWGSVDELVGAYLFLASSAASFITGTVITVDGGYAIS